MIPKEILALQGEMTAWRRDLHAHPEPAFQEHRTAAFVARVLGELGYSVTTGVGRTGVVGTLTVGPGPSIALRADMDALEMQEEGEVAHRSVHPGRMHACGHDGHVAMLLGAAKHLAATRRFAGTVHLIFQPAEENEGGGRVMVEDGLFDRFPAAAVYGLHNWPSLPLGRIAVADGPVMASFDIFEVVLRAHGTHAAMPHAGTDAIVAASQLVLALQTITSREIDPHDAAVVSVTQIRGGDTWNVLPSEVVLRGTARSLRPEVQDQTESSIRRIAESIATAHRVAANTRYERRYPPTVNTKDEAAHAAAAAADVVGEPQVDRNLRPSMGGEDFAFMLQQRPGCYAWLGTGTPTPGPGLHNPRFDFNDDALAIGASYWVRVVEGGGG